ncbi:MAG: RluA family pseudouridine synthase [Alphaproteobacteria bacterium]|nr:RluA family pseudouridine synthase [Alphaproteobacteria bacterium]
MRLDKFLVLNIPEISRSRLQELIEGEFVRAGTVFLKLPSFKVKEGQLIEVKIPPLEEAIPLPQWIPLDILYEDEDLIVVNKPAGMVVHPAPGHSEGTLVNALLSHCGESLSGINGVKRPGIVHRLDKETSGLLVAAKNDRAHRHLSYQLSTHQMRRVYNALVWGMLLPQEGIIEGAIGRDRYHRQRMALCKGGKPALTHYKITKFFGRIASLVECRLETGRTHQIRVHLTAKGHSLIGDGVYGKIPKSIPLVLKEFLLKKWLPGRQALHAKELSFFHPSTHKQLLFSATLPEDMRNLIDVLNYQTQTTVG